MCIHYSSGCNVKSKCCDKFYNCFRCHDLFNEWYKTCGLPHHTFDRSGLEKVQCHECETIQDPGEKCIQCGNSFGNYVCLKCALFTDSTIDHTHCDQCGICMRAKSDEIEHCVDCGFCYPIVYKEAHMKNHVDRSITKETLCGVCEKPIIGSPHKYYKCTHCNNYLHLNCLLYILKYAQGI